MGHTNVFKGVTHIIVMTLYSGLAREKVLEIYQFVMTKRNESRLGQRKLYGLVKENFNTEINENTIAGWIFRKIIPFNNEKTQFKPKPMPKKEELYNSYINHSQSAEKLGKKYKVSTIIVINWLKFYGIKVRNHLQSMNTRPIKEELRKQKLIMPKNQNPSLSPEKSYVLGVLCGDGCVGKSYIRLEIRNDKEFIEEFVRCFNETYGTNYGYHYYKKRDSFVTHISSQMISADLLKSGLFGTFEWKIPSEVLNSPSQEIYRGFLRGLFDSEGSTSKYVVSMSSANESGINQVSKLLEKMDIPNKVIKTKKGYYVLYITSRERLQKFRDKIGFTIKRKMLPLEYLK